MRLYHHRINTLEALGQVPLDRGIEFDLRSDGDRVIVVHEPAQDGPTIEEFFPQIGPRPCIFNVKCEGIEARVLAEALRHGVTDFFFLDCSVPAAVKLGKIGEKRIAVRYSDIEPIEAVLAWQGRATWVWVDCFEPSYPGTVENWARIARAFSVCLVSPELEGHGAERIAAMRTALGPRAFDAVCTKRPDLWLAP